MADYVLPHTIPQEDERLTLMSRMLDPQMFFRLEQIGVGPGWKCLEVGAGNGSVSHWLAEKVGPEGHVVASDIDTRFLDRLSLPNLEVRRIDVTRDPLGSGYDLVCGRAFLHHIPQRIDVLGRLAEAVRPGGFLLVEEPDFHPVLASDSPLVRDFWQGFLAWAADHGIDYFVGRRLGALLDGLGFRIPRCTARPSSSTAVAARALPEADDAGARDLARRFGPDRTDGLDRGHGALRQPEVLDLAEQLRDHQRPQAHGLDCVGAAPPPAPPRDSLPLQRDGVSGYSESPCMEVSRDGEARLRNEPVPGRLRRPPGVRARSRALPSLHRAGARPDRQRLRPPPVRDHALLGRGPSRMGRGGTRVRGGVAAPAEMGRVALAEVGRPQRHAGRG